MTEPAPPAESVCLAYIHPGHITGRTSESLLQLQTHHPTRIATRLIRYSGPLVAKSRNDIIDMFLRNAAADWLLFIDADMVFERDALERLHAAADPQERPIVGALCFTGEGRSGIRPVMDMWDPVKGHGHILPDPIPPNTLMQVDATGAAFLLVHRGILEKMRQRWDTAAWGSPWFEETMSDGNVTGEDLNFCRKARDAGAPVFVHTGVAVGHEKTRVVGLEDYRLQQWDYKVAPRSLRFVVTGTGRNGSAYVAEVFRNLGVPCGHEEVFNPFPYRKRGLVGESSWMAVPALPGLVDAGVKVFHQVRDPLRVVNSLLGDGALTLNALNPYRQFMAENTRTLTWEDPVVDAMRFYVEWNDRIEPFADALWRVEDFGENDIVVALHSALGVDHVPGGWLSAALDVPPWRRNKHSPAGLGWGDLPDGAVKDRLLAMGGRYGYTVG